MRRKLEMQDEVSNIRDCLESLSRLANLVEEADGTEHDLAVLIYNSVKVGLQSLDHLRELLDA